MAAAIIPLVMGLAPTLINLIVGLVHKKAPLVETQLGAGTGPVKFATVFGEVISALQTAAAAGAIDGHLPDDALIKIVIQSSVASMQRLGLLNGTVDAIPTGARDVVLSAGQSVTISVK
ncbi:MAG: hypothetical protein NVS9B4_00640 [Candidatus Acidiferrum sp.]